MTTLVRVCDATYDKAPIEKEGIQVLVSYLLKLSDAGNHLQLRGGDSLCVLGGAGCLRLAESCVIPCI